MTLRHLCSSTILVFVIAIAGCGGPPEAATELAPPSEMPAEEEESSTEAAFEAPAASETTPQGAAGDAAVSSEPFHHMWTFEGEMPEVVARIGDEEVTSEDFMRAVKDTQRRADTRVILASRMSGQAAEPKTLSTAALQLVFDNYINERIALAMAQESGIDADDEAIEARVEEGMASLETQDNFNAYMSQFELTEEIIRQRIREQFIREKFFEQQVGDCEAAEEEIKARYEELKAAGLAVGPGLFDFHQVFIAVPQEAPADTWTTRKADILAAEQRILAGEDIEEVSVEVSDLPKIEESRGHWKDIPEQMLHGTFRNVLDELPIGELSDPIRMHDGWHLLRLNERRPSGGRTLEDMRETIAGNIEQRCRSEQALEIVEDAKELLGVTIYYSPSKGKLDPPQ